MQKLLVVEDEQDFRPQTESWKMILHRKKNWKRCGQTSFPPYRMSLKRR